MSARPTWAIRSAVGKATRSSSMSSSFNDKGWLTGTGTFHSDALHVTERYTRIDKDQIDYVITMEDPERADEAVDGEDDVDAAGRDASSGIRVRREQRRDGTLRENPERRRVLQAVIARSCVKGSDPTGIVDFSGAPVPEEPTNSRRPSAKVRSRPFAPHRSVLRTESLDHDLGTLRQTTSARILADRARSADRLRSSSVRRCPSASSRRGGSRCAD